MHTLHILTNKMVYIYILKLENGKYYVGKTTNPSFRIERHFNSTGSAWTSKYKPVSVETIIPDCDDYDEDKHTKKYMAKYGIENVRGGSYVQIELSEFHTEALKMEIWGANDLCTQCGRSGHFVKDCYAKTDISGNAIEYEEESDDVWCCEYCDRTFTTEFGCGVHEKSCKNKNATCSTKEKGACYRCGRQGHYSPNCYATRDIKGNYLS